MAKDKVCKSCKIVVEGNECPICKGKLFSTSWQGKITILDAKRSFVAREMGIEINGRYAIKVR